MQEQCRSQRWEQPRNSLISQMKDAEAGKYGSDEEIAF